MGLTTIYITRHGFRGNWTLDPHTGTYAAAVPSPTNIPSDPPLAAHGVSQSHSLSRALLALPPPPLTRIYSSPFYRCLQTLAPFAEASGRKVRVETGLGEWYGRARFEHPSPASVEVLQGLFPWVEEGNGGVVPSKNGERIGELHERCAVAMSRLIDAEDAENAQCIDGEGVERAILICTHAASLIAIGRVLTGAQPEDVCEDDFRTFTCGISKFVRRGADVRGEGLGKRETRTEVPRIDWRDGKGVGGGWDCVMNSDCTHLERGEERGWHFHGDEGFDDTHTPEEVGSIVSTDQSRIESKL